MNTESGKSSWKSVNVVPVAQPKSRRQEQEPLSKQDVLQPRMRIVSNPGELPIPTIASKVIPIKDLAQPPNRYVNSRAEAKAAVSSATSSKGVPQYIGSTFTHLPNAANRPLLPPSRNVTTARPMPVLTASAYSNVPMMSNRAPDGTILGSPSKQFVPEAKVPYLPPDEPVGPDNPVKSLNDTWTACWDNEAGAIYYYNQISGEATWIPPEL